jgi:hypothetical protein
MQNRENSKLVLDHLQETEADGSSDTEECHRQTVYNNEELFANAVCNAVLNFKRECDGLNTYFKLKYSEIYDYLSMLTRKIVVY